MRRRVRCRDEEGDVPLREGISGRGSRHNISNSITDQSIVKENEINTREVAAKIESLGIDSVQVRSPLTCDTPRGVCAYCYGADMSTGQLVEEGLAVGTIAAQSIGEPGTQLTMRTFHTGGIAARGLVENSYRANYSGAIEIRECNEIEVETESEIEAETEVAAEAETETETEETPEQDEAMAVGNAEFPDGSLLDAIPAELRDVELPAWAMPRDPSLEPPAGADNSSDGANIDTPDTFLVGEYTSPAGSKRTDLAPPPDTPIPTAELLNQPIGDLSALSEEQVEIAPPGSLVDAADFEPTPRWRLGL